MSMPTDAVDAYRAQLARCARSLCLAELNAVTGDLPATATVEQVKMFTDGNMEKRFQKLRDQLELVADAFENMDDFVEEFVRRVTLEAYATGSSDTDRFLQWLSEKQPLSGEQRDVVTCQRSRIAVEELARKNRIGHIHFQELWSISEHASPTNSGGGPLRLHLNPIHVWATFQTRTLLDEDDDLPAQVVFYPVQSDIRTAVLEPDAERLVRTVERAGPCPLDLLAVSDVGDERENLMELCRDLAEMGLAAIA